MNAASTDITNIVVYSITVAAMNVVSSLLLLESFSYHCCYDHPSQEDLTVRNSFLGELYQS